jgi:mlo protein
MAGGGGTGISLEHTPTWAVAVVCFFFISISVILEQFIHLLTKVCFSFSFAGVVLFLSYI